MDITELKKMTISELADHARKLKVDSITGLKKADIIYKILEAQTKRIATITQNLLRFGHQGPHTAKVGSLNDIVKLTESLLNHLSNKNQTIDMMSKL